jgi:DNA polymerase III alpha subunit (gram-positive type)
MSLGKLLSLATKGKVKVGNISIFKGQSAPFYVEKNDTIIPINSVKELKEVLIETISN